jgi:hypothetical protein
MLRHFSTTALRAKNASASALSAKVPSSTKEVPDVATFLGKIGRNTKEFSEAFPTWDALFTSSSKDMKTAGIDCKQRKYILHQVECYRKAAFVERINPSTVLHEIKAGVKKHGGERKLNQYLAKKRILDRIETAKAQRQFRKAQKSLEMKYQQLDKLHAQQNHHL